MHEKGSWTDLLIHWNETHKIIHARGILGSAISANSPLMTLTCFSSSILIRLEIRSS
jgi:hypothetical protein